MFLSVRKTLCRDQTKPMPVVRLDDGAGCVRLTRSAQTAAGLERRAPPPPVDSSDSSDDDEGGQP